MVRESQCYSTDEGLITREGRAEGKSPSEGKRWGSNKGLAENQTRRTEEGSEVIQKGT